MFQESNINGKYYNQTNEQKTEYLTRLIPHLYLTCARRSLAQLTL